MTLSTLDLNTALIVIDLQKGIVALPTAHSTEVVIRNARTLADAFRRHGLPVVLVNVTGRPPGRAEQTRHLGETPSDWADLVTELNRQPDDHIVTKRTPGAFTGTDLEAYLKGKGVTQLVIVGVATSMGVESTGRHAHELGFNVTLAVDAMTDMSAECHDNSVMRVFPRMAETGTTQAVLDLLEKTRGSRPAIDFQLEHGSAS